MIINYTEARHNRTITYSYSRTEPSEGKMLKYEKGNGTKER